jgi:hypothetical protein
VYKQVFGEMGKFFNTIYSEAATSTYTEKKEYGIKGKETKSPRYK